MLLISELLTAVNNTLETWKVSDTLLTGHGISNATLWWMCIKYINPHLHGLIEACQLKRSFLEEI